jgi:hypothetical protein
MNAINDDCRRLCVGACAKSRVGSRGSLSSTSRLCRLSIPERDISGAADSDNADRHVGTLIFRRVHGMEVKGLRVAGGQQNDERQA